MAYTDDLRTARDQMAARLKDITVSPKPSYSIDGQSISWGDYIAQLTDGLARLDGLISGGEPFEVVSQGIT